MAKRKNNIDDIDIVDDFELEDIDDFDPFDVLDDSYEDKKSYGNDKPRGGNASNKRNKIKEESSSCMGRKSRCDTFVNYSYSGDISVCCYGNACVWTV